MIQPAVAVVQTPLVIDIHPMTADDHAFVRHTWRESYKAAPKMEKLTWPAYKATTGKLIDQLIERPDVSLLGAYEAGHRIVGWLAYTPGRSISTLHYVYTRHELDGQQLRRRGVMTDLITAAGLGRRFVFTFHGPRRQRGVPMDETLVEVARAKGVTATYAPIEEFLR